MEMLDEIKRLKNQERGRIADYCKFSKTAKYFGEKTRPWGVANADLAFPCATQNEIELKDAEALKLNGVYLVAEGANMPSNADAINFYFKNHFLYGPAKAANAAGVACSGLEMTQNSMRIQWPREEVEEKLHAIM